MLASFKVVKHPRGQFQFLPPPFTSNSFFFFVFVWTTSVQSLRGIYSTQLIASFRSLVNPGLATLGGLDFYFASSFASHKNDVNTLIEHTFRDTFFNIRRSPSWRTTTLKVMAMAPAA
jgi:hypothetical protein